MSNSKIIMFQYKLFRKLTIFTLVLFSSEVVAQSAEECVSIQDPNDRLNCFDQVFLETETRPASAGSAWDVRIETSPLDDSTSVFLTVLSEEAIMDRFGQGGAAQLTVRCMENRTSVGVNFAGLFMSDIQGRDRVDFRVDDSPPDNIRMRASTNNMSLGLWRGGESIPFIQSHLLGGESLYLRATPFSESAVEMRFNISGLDGEIGPLREACNW